VNWRRAAFSWPRTPAIVVMVTTVLALSPAPLRATGPPITTPREVPGARGHDESRAPSSVARRRIFAGGGLTLAGNETTLVEYGGTGVVGCEVADFPTLTLAVRGTGTFVGAHSGALGWGRVTLDARRSRRTRAVTCFQDLGFGFGLVTGAVLRFVTPGIRDMVRTTAGNACFEIGTGLRGDPDFGPAPHLELVTAFGLGAQTVASLELLVGFSF
jgi:hypothetical protein